MSPGMNRYRIPGDRGVNIVLICGWFVFVRPAMLLQVFWNL